MAKAIRVPKARPRKRAVQAPVLASTPYKFGKDEFISALAALDEEALLYVGLACLPSAALHGAHAQIWPDGTGGFRDRAGIERVRAAAVTYCGLSEALSK